MEMSGAIVEFKTHLAAFLILSGAEFIGIEPSPQDDTYLLIRLRPNGNSERLLALREAYVREEPGLMVDIVKHAQIHGMLQRRIANAKRFR